MLHIKVLVWIPLEGVPRFVKHSIKDIHFVRVKVTFGVEPI